MSVGRIIAGKYCLLSELGRGAMGSVWAAEHLALRSMVAVKLIEQQVLGLPNIKDRFEREARALATLRSPHVVQILDYGVDSETQYLVMELLHGETLRRRLEARGRLDASEVWTIIQHVSRAMVLTHAAGFVHRDLKPENIFLTSNGDELVAKVLDFGITKTLASQADLTKAGMMLGTCHYMSPEQAKGLSVDSRSDVWSLGVITFECLTGLLPFRAESLVAAISAICHAPVVVPSEVARVPASFDAWFARAVCRGSEQRFQSVQELAEALKPILHATNEWVGSDAAPCSDPEDDTQRMNVFPSSVYDRRADVRIPSSIPAGIDGRRDLRSTALVFNASRSGALLVTRCSWEPNRPIELALHLDSPIQGELVRAHVVRVSPRDDAFWKFEVAVGFDEPLPDALLARLEAKAKS